MPRPPRRAPQPRDAPATTPTRQGAPNAITAAIPPFMLETPPHAPFLATPVPPSNNPGNSIVPNGNHRTRHVRQQHQTPAAEGVTPDQAPEQLQTSHQTPASEAGRDEHSLIEPVGDDQDDVKQLVGLRDISSLATWTLSSSKPGCALTQLRHPSPSYFWQSDGPQPHTLTLHFFKLVAIVKMRVYLDFELDESYTPTKMKFFAGMSEGALVEFGVWEVHEHTDPETGEVHSGVEGIRGWIDIDLDGVGGREAQHDAEQQGAFDGVKGNKVRDPGGNRTIELDEQVMKTTNHVGGDILKAMVVQVRICENHQNGKDTHVRGFQVFARDENVAREVRWRRRKHKVQGQESEEMEDQKQVYAGLEPTDWMRHPEIR